MKNHLTILKLTISFIFLFGTLTSNGQAKIEAQIGGANFLGLTLNAAYDISISKNGNHFLTPSFGLGLLAPGWNASTIIIHTGLNYNFKRFGLGVELSGFNENPFFADEHNESFVDIIIYPNANYTFINKEHWYFRFSGGIYLAYSKTYDDNTDTNHMSFDGDPVPGAGITVGYKF